jgi:FkbM family methyltransferase
VNIVFLKKIKRFIKWILRKEVFFTIQKKRLQTDCIAQYQICNENMDKDSIVYSFGIGRDIDFEKDIINKYGINIFGFDPTPVTSEWLSGQKIPDEFHYYEYGIADYDGSANFYQLDNPSPVSMSMVKGKKSHSGEIEVKVYKLKTIMKMLNHDHIDLLKMDIEGEEYQVIENIISDNIEIKQIIIEFHHRFKNIGIKKTKSIIKLLNENNYQIFAISDLGEEYSFIKVY